MLLDPTTLLIYLVACATLYIVFLALYTLCVGLFLAGTAAYLWLIVCWYDITPPYKSMVLDEYRREEALSEKKLDCNLRAM
jgi:hypothetical protein